RLTSRGRTLLVVTPLIVIGLLLTPVFRAGIGLDGLAYVSIARQYADGGLPINGYWGPLWSWLLAPLLVIGVEPLFAARVLQVASSVLVLVALRRLLDVVGVRPAVRDGLALAVTPFLVAIAHYGIFTDVLMAGFLLLWCAEVLRADFPMNRAVAVRAGLWAGLATLTKIYALPFVLVHLAVVAVLHLYRIRNTPRAIVKVGSAVGLVSVVLALLFVPWVAALTAHYDRFTVTKSARYNVTIAGPGSQGNPIFYAGLLAPPSPDAVSIWEEPSRMPVDATGWGAGGESADRLVDNIAGNLALAADLIPQEMVVLSVLGLAGTALVFLPLKGAGRAPPDLRFKVLGLLAAASVYAGGYLLLFLERRYTWFLVVLLVIPAGLAIQAALDWVPARWRRLVLLVLSVFLAFTVAVQSIPRLMDERGADERTQEVASALRDDGGLPGPVASNGFWERTAVICFQLDCQYYGQPRPFEMDEGLQDHLATWGIRTFVAWGEPLEQPPGPEVTPKELENVHIYSVPGPSEQG
ncbi:MAG: hypothetical protein WBG57_06845, partial [Ornithinimicrobium sp.]